MREILEQFDIWSGMDILLMSMIIYQGLLLIRGTRTAQVLTGIIVLIAIFLLSSTFPLTTLNWLMNKFAASAVLIMVILFQDDIRHALSKIGKKSFMNTGAKSDNMLLDELVKAAEALATAHIGALIVFERSILLSRFIDIGILIDAQISREIMMSIFHTSSPIHDGAVIIRSGRIAAAGCFLPLTREENLENNLGTRHRAGIGISQETDAFVILVSEERGTISIVSDGFLEVIKTADELKAKINKNLMIQEIDEDELEVEGNAHA